MDKGRCTIFLNSREYDAKMLNFLGDTNTYEKLFSHDPSDVHLIFLLDLPVVLGKTDEPIPSLVSEVQQL